MRKKPEVTPPYEKKDPGIVRRDGETICIVGPFTLRELPFCTAALHHLQTLEYQDVVLDFSACTAAFAGAMCMLCVETLNLRAQGLSTALIEPRAQPFRRLFRSANWAHLLDPDHNPATAYSGGTHFPARQFRTDAEQSACVRMMVGTLLSVRTNMTRSDLAAVEWALGEITGNVMTHAQSAIGGVAQVTNYPEGGRIELVVADRGLTIPRTLRGGFPDIASDEEALNRAIQEGVTRDPNEGQGNGLFGTYQLTRHTGGGRLTIASGYAKLSHNERGVKMEGTRVPTNGTLVVAAMGSASPGALHRALRFRDGIHEPPVDFIEMQYEPEDTDDIVVPISEADSLFSREAARQMRNKIHNLFRMNPGRMLAVDFSDVDLISSSFADECIGKLITEVGAQSFSERVRFSSMSDIVRDIVTHAAAKRTANEGQ